tara:strand:- start:2168 stop:2587 length:420 start_codon:yes stop_codon:yes gene_type:complete
MKLTRKILRESLIREINSQKSTCKKKDIIVNSTPIRVEIADTPELRDRGLMFRKSIPENQGMLFDFFNDDDRGFWMKNTNIPLSIAFIDSSGVISNIEKMTPHSMRSVYSKKPCRYALEMNLGWFDKNGILPGSKCSLE